jgi:hypothetical protein
MRWAGLDQAMSWLFEIFMNTPPGRIVRWAIGAMWAVLFTFVTAKLLLQHAWVYAAVAAILPVLVGRRLVREIRMQIRSRRPAPKLSGRFPSAPRR